MAIRSALRFPVFVLLIVSCGAFAAEKSRDHCQNQEADSLLQEAMALQRDLESEQALILYNKCLRIDPECTPCLYESGWSHWKLGQWAEVVKTWEKVQAKDKEHPDVAQFLPTARENLALVKVKKIPNAFVSGVPIGKKSEPEESPLSLLFLTRRQSYNREPVSPMDHFDPDIQSPKSVHYSRDGKKVYVNSLEGGRTVIYDALGLKKIGLISHRFGEEEKDLFPGKQLPWGYRWPKAVTDPNHFLGKPVEIEHSHKGKYLWIPYYRRSFDGNGSLPSAVAVVDTSLDKIVRVMPVGPISKYVRRSHNGKWMAVSHWGDNTVGLIDIRAKDPAGFKHSSLLVVEKRVDPKHLTGDRDRNCGFCVRGLAFSGNDQYLFVSRMKGGGISVFHLRAGKSRYLGTIFGIVLGPRDLEISESGDLYISCNASGVVARLPWKKIVAKLGEIPRETEYEKRFIRVKPNELQEEKVYVGLGARSIRLSNNESTLYVTVNQTSELVGVDTKTMNIAARIPVDSFPVGLDLSPDDSNVWVTSQGRSAKGGNSVGVFQARYKKEEIVPAATKP